ncbi:hypothetical protein ACIPSE_11320 [Streptomyces sp. NPDC090106]|uniref:hypothetical protein n=1 Tax=Streptomyces sp. NPDC090106 TaxID=3365946 RepID=UPI00381C7678
MTSTFTEVEPTPVFVDQTGQRGRRLRGLGWLLGIACTGLVVAMTSGLVGTQSQAPALDVPATADTTPPSQYLNAPLPTAPGVAGSVASGTATEADPEATASATVPDATASVITTPTDGTASTAVTAAAQ